MLFSARSARHLPILHSASSAAAEHAEKDQDFLEELPEACVIMPCDPPDKERRDSNKHQKRQESFISNPIEVEGEPNHAMRISLAIS
jgi:hypothetical protein